MVTTYTLVTSYNHEGVAYALPIDWRDRVATLGEDPMAWSEWDAASILTDELNAVLITWEEDETFATFAAAVRATGFTVPTSASLEVERVEDASTVGAVPSC